MKTQNNSQDKSATTRCAIYTRYSSDLQRPTSTEDQIRECRQESERHEGWRIAEEWVLSDREVSGRSLVGRDALAALKEGAKRKPRPFDCIIIDDTSRLGRNVPDVLKLAEFFEHYGVSIQFVSPSLNSGDPNFRPLLIFKAMMDEQYSAGLADKVRRGLKGRVLKGYNAGGACYGYRNVEDVDPNGKGDGILGVHLQIVPEQADIVLRIFEMYAKGSSFDRIARALRAKGVTAPKPPRTNSARGWSADGISEILRNKKYIGIYEWGRTRSGYDPDTGRTVTKKRPETEWVRYNNEKWRIVSDELWDKVQGQLALKKKMGISKEGGLSRTNRSQQYLFSGLMCCGICSGNVRIVDGSGDDMRYGCGVHRDKAACSNAITIRQDRLQEQLLSWLTRDLMEGNSLNALVAAFHAQVEKRVSELQAEARKNAINAPELLKQLAGERLERRNIMEFIAKVGARADVTLLDDLAERDDRIQKLEEQLAHAKQPEPNIAFTADAIRAHLLTKLLDLQSVLTSAPLVGKQIIRKHIRKITLTPGEADGTRVLHVTVEFELGGENSGVLLTDGVDASSQQYGFSTLTVTGLALDVSRVRRKAAPVTRGAESCVPGFVPPTLKPNALTEGLDSESKEIAA